MLKQLDFFSIFILSKDNFIGKLIPNLLNKNNFNSSIYAANNMIYKQRKRVMIEIRKKKLICY